MNNFYMLAARFNLKPHDAFHGDALVLWLIIALIIFSVFVIFGVISFLPHRSVKREKAQGAEPTLSFSTRVKNVEKDYVAQKISKQEAYHQLAAIARQFASSKLGEDVTSRTLAELRASGQHSGLNLLKTTIEGLYPPQFAFEATQPPSTKASVHEACQWVLALIERWDS